MLRPFRACSKLKRRPGPVGPLVPGWPALDRDFGVSQVPLATWDSTLRCIGLLAVQLRFSKWIFFASFLPSCSNQVLMVFEDKHSGILKERQDLGTEEFRSQALPGPLCCSPSAHMTRGRWDGGTDP